MTEREQELRACLEKLGWDESEVWVAREPDYVELTGATPEDIPFLVGVMKEWLDDREWDDDDETLWAPLHAWRILAHLGDIAALGDLLSMLDPLNEMQSDFLTEEFPHVFRFMGAPALPRLRDFLVEPGHDAFVHVPVAHGVCYIGQDDPEARAEAIRVLAECLSAQEKNDPTLNAHLVGYLCDLDAKEEAVLIEKAFAADCVDVAVVGNWNMVKKELGVPGTGLVPEALANKKWAPIPGFEELNKTISRITKKNVDHAARAAAKAKKKKRKAEKAKRKRGRR